MGGCLVQWSASLLLYGLIESFRETRESLISGEEGSRPERASVEWMALNTTEADHNTRKGVYWVLAERREHICGSEKSKDDGDSG